MQRVDTATAAAAPPTQNAPGTPGYFTQGNPTSGTPATVPGQDWFNQAQEELVAPILAEGLSLSKTDNTQLYQAIRRIAARSSNGMSNVNFASSVSANALTNALKGQNGADPSATNPVEVTFRSTTLIDTGLVLRRFTAGMAITAPQGATLGFIANEIGYVYKYLVDNGATQQLGVTKGASFDESQLHNTTAIGTGSDSDNVLYTTSAVSNAAVRLIGRELIQAGAIAGDWSIASTRREVWSPEFKKMAAAAAGFARVTENMCRIINYTTDFSLGRDAITLVTGPAGATGLILQLNTIAAANNAVSDRNSQVTVYSDAAASVRIARHQVAGREHVASPVGSFVANSDVEVHVKCDSLARVWLVFADDTGNQGSASYSIVGYYD